MTQWCPLMQFFFDETLRHDGLGDALDEKKCPCCDAAYTRTSHRFRCGECGVFTQCLSCVRSRHSLSPLHRIRWNGTFWAPTTLQKIGCVYQLGHGGHPCLRPAPTVHEMVVMDTEAIHTISYRYCGCDRSDHANNLQQLLRNSWYPATTVDPQTCATFTSLETFRTLNVVGNINVHNFVGAMERQTDPCLVVKVPDRYKSFGLMSRQYSFLKRMKRAGRGHDPQLLHATKRG
ncbi:hypothetical protein B0H16DRAFT_1338947, partial [Mycena metata]